MRIPIKQIKSSQFATRPRPLEVKSLAESIKKFGQLQPIKVRPVDSGYECVFGTRRLAALQEAGFAEVEAIVQDLDDRQARLQVWEENEEREDLDDVARARFLRAYKNDYGMTQDGLALQFGLGQSHISHLLSLLDEPQEIQEAIITAGITERHARMAREVLGDDIESRQRLIREAIEENLTSDEVRFRARAIRYQQRTGGFKRKDEDWRQLPSVKALVSHIQELREWMRLGRAMVNEEKLAPEAKRFLANKLKHLIRALSEWKEELESG